MAQIIQRTFTTGEVVSAIQLRMEDYIRPLNCGSNWNRIRVGILCAIDGYIATSRQIPQYCWMGNGLCSGPTAGFHSLTSNVMGVAHGGTSSVTTVGGQFLGAANLVWNGGYTNFYRKVNSTQSMTQGGNAAPVWPRAGALDAKSIFIADYTRNGLGTPWSVSAYGTQTNPLNFTYTELAQVVQMFVGTTPQNLTLQASDMRPTITDDAGFSHLCLTWPHPHYALEVYGIAVHKFY